MFILKKKKCFQQIYKKYKNQDFKIAEDVDGRRIKIPLKYFLEYMTHQTDDYPLYLFGSVNKKGKNSQCLLDEMEIPPYFKDDILCLVDEKKRPPFRWFLLGPKRSGSQIHIDPFKTSAWNTLFSGAKRWVMMPENVQKSFAKGKQYIENGKNF